MKKLFIACLLILGCVLAEGYSGSGAELKALREKNMPKEYFADPVGYLEKQCAKGEEGSWMLADEALSLALYYLGFPKEILLSIYNYYDREPNMCPAPEFKPLLIRGKIRDAKKAIYWMKASYSFAWGTADVIEFHFYFLDKFRFEGLDGKEEQAKNFEEILKYAYANRDWDKETMERKFAYYKRLVSLNGKGNYICVSKGGNCLFNGILGYMFYRGIGVKKDIWKAKLHASITYISFWKNFYTGYAAPLDQEYARFLLKAIDTDESKKILADIERGVYDKKAEQ